jgi:hypothetical protein
MNTQHAALRWCTAVLALVAFTGLAGCSTTRMVDSEVRSFANNPPAAAPTSTYRFERLPSQQANTAQHEQLERMVAQTLGDKGLVRNDNQARYTVQVQWRTDSYTSDPDGTGLGLRWGFGLGIGGPAWGMRSGIRHMPPTWYKTTLDLLLRDTSTAQVVYETHATHDGPWADTANLLPALVQAALRDYPQAVAGPRTIVVELPPSPN